MERPAFRKVTQKGGGKRICEQKEIVEESDGEDLTDKRKNGFGPL